MGPIIPLKALVPIEWIQSLRLAVERESLGIEMENWVDNLVKQVRESEERKKDDQERYHSPSRQRRVSIGEEEDGVEEGKVKLHPPHLTFSGGPAPGRHVPLSRQGPIMYDPAPQEIGADIDEDVASDILFFGANEDGDAVMAVCWAGGRVDLGVIVDPLLPRWQDSKVRFRDGGWAND